MPAGAGAIGAGADATDEPATSLEARFFMPHTPSDRIKQIIRKQGHTYQSLGDEIGISPQAISEIVNGRTKGATARYALSAALGFEVDDLWPGSRNGDRTGS